MTTFQQVLIQRLANNKKRKQNGFTLIELMVVVAIVGVLSAVALPQMTKAQDRAKDAVAKSEVVNAGKDCSVILLTETDGSSFDASLYPTVTGTCGAGSTLTGTSEGTDGNTFTVTMTDDGLPGAVEDV